MKPQEQANGAFPDITNNSSHLPPNFLQDQLIGLQSMINTTVLQLDSFPENLSKSEFETQLTALPIRAEKKKYMLGKKTGTTKTCLHCRLTC